MTRQRDKSALILAGGGIMGAAYEIGALTALDRLFRPGFSSRRFELYIGISAGAVIAALIANRIKPADLFRVIANNESSVFNWTRRDIYRLEPRQILGACWDLGKNLFRIFRNYRRKGWPFSFNEIFFVLQEQFPAGLFALDPLQDYLCQSFRQEGVRDDFAALETELLIPAYDLDRGRRVVFGTPENRDLHICQAITASCAIPYFFRPYAIGRHRYIDGSSGRMAHLDLAIEKGARLVVVVNPRVPMDNDPERACLPSLSTGSCSSIDELGISIAWEQAQRIENKEKLDMALEACRQRHPDVDIVMLEPSREESMLFFQSPMSQIARNHVMTHAYHLTLNHLRANYEELDKIFARHGIDLRADRLETPPPVDVAPAQD